MAGSDNYGHIVNAFQFCLHKISPEINNAHQEGPAVATTTNLTSTGLSSLSMLFDTATYSSHRIPIVRQILVYCYAILILCGTTFNLAVLFALLFFRNQTFSNIANIFVFTLAASDVVLCGVSMPIQLYYGINGNSQVNTALCRTLFAGFGIPMYVSCLTILLIAIDRHRLIVKPTVPRVSVRSALGLILTTVVFSALNAVPVGLYTESRGISGFRSFCVEAWPLPGFRLVYSVAIFVVHFLLPLLVSGGLYLEIYRRLATRPEQLSLSKESGRRKRRTTTLLACVVVCFAICWTPWCLFSLLVEIDAYFTKGSNAPHIKVNFSELTVDGCTVWLTRGRLGGNQSTDEINPPVIAPPMKSFIRGTHVTLVDMVLKLWAMGSACINPFLYGWLNRPIREAMITLYEMISSFCFRSIMPRTHPRDRVDCNALSERITGKSDYHQSCLNLDIKKNSNARYSRHTVECLLPQDPGNSNTKRGSGRLFCDYYRCCVKHSSTSSISTGERLGRTTKQPRHHRSRRVVANNSVGGASFRYPRSPQVPTNAVAADVVVIVEGPTSSRG